MSVAADVTPRIRELIVQKGLTRGDRLPSERELAADLGVSRPALREGLRHLIDLGVLQPRRGSGTYIAGADNEDLLDVRDRLEPHAARLAARSRTAIDLAAFDRILDDLRAGDQTSYNELRLALGAASGNSVLAHAISNLVELEPGGSVRVGNRLVKEMTRVVERVRDGDGAGARQADAPPPAPPPVLILPAVRPRATAIVDRTPPTG